MEVTLYQSLESVMSSLFNEATYSDCNLYFKSSGTTLYLHKNIICKQSEFFRMCFASGMAECETNTIEIEPQENEYLIRILMRALYTEQLVFCRSNLMSLICLAEKYMTDSWQFLLSREFINQLNETNILDCLHVNLDAQTEIRKCFEFLAKQHGDAILRGDSYFGLDAERFQTLLKTVIHEKNGMLGIEAVTNWVDHNEEERAAYSHILTKDVKNASKNAMEVPDVTFNLRQCGKNITLYNGYRRAQKDFSKGWNCVVLGTKTNKYKIRLLEHCNTLMLGFARSTVEKEGAYELFTAENKYFLYCYDGSIWNSNGAKRYCGDVIKQGSVIEVVLRNHTIAFIIDGVRHGTAFYCVSTNDIYPAFELNDAQCSFEFV